MTKLENALVWLYVMTWEKFGEHVINEKDLWNFGGDDLEAALMGLAFPRKSEKTERTKELNKLIMGFRIVMIKCPIAKVKVIQMSILKVLKPKNVINFPMKIIKAKIELIIIVRRGTRA